MALLDLRRGDLDGALAAYEALRKLDPNNSLILVRMGQIQAEKKNTEQAIAIFQQVLAKEPANGEARYALGLTLEERHLKALDEASRIDLGFPHEFLERPGIKQVIFQGADKLIDPHNF